MTRSRLFYLAVTTMVALARARRRHRRRVDRRPQRGPSW